MIEWINVLVMGVSSVSMLYLYVKSVGPAALENKIGKDPEVSGSVPVLIII